MSQSAQFVNGNIFPILVYFAIIVVNAVAMLAISTLMGPRRSTRSKDVVYECGKDVHVDAREPVNISFYLVAVLFLLFDVEMIFLIPWALEVKNFAAQSGATWLIVGEMAFFLAILLGGLLYCMSAKKQALRWE